MNNSPKACVFHQALIIVCKMHFLKEWLIFFSICKNIASLYSIVIMYCNNYWQSNNSVKKKKQYCICMRNKSLPAILSIHALIFLNCLYTLYHISLRIYFFETTIENNSLIRIVIVKSVSITVSTVVCVLFQSTLSYLCYWSALSKMFAESTT